VSEHPPEPAIGPHYSPDPGPREPRYLKPRWRKAGRILWIVALSLLAFFVLLTAGLLVWLHTGGGAETLGRSVANEARNAIEGDLRVRAIRVRGFLRVCVDGVELRDPDGHRVLSAEQACVSLRPLSLLRHHITVTDAELKKPWIELAKEPGTSETTLQRAVRPRKPPQPGEGGPFAWRIEVQKLRLQDGSVTVRPEVGAEATLALGDLDVSQAHARYAADSAAAALDLTARLEAPGQAPVALAVDATLEGAAPGRTIALRTLRVKLGESGFSANGSWDLARQAGEIRLRDVAVLPRDLAAIAPKAPLEGAVRGEADFKSDGKTAGADLRLQAGGGRLDAKLTSTLEKAPTWDVQLNVEKVDPGAISARAPKGEVTARASLHGKGFPRFDAHGVQGDLRGTVHVGPARLDRVGPVVADLDASLLRRYAIVRAFTAGSIRSSNSTTTAESPAATRR